MPVEIEVEGLAEAIDRFAQGNAQIGKALHRATYRSVQLLRKKLARYPRPSTGKAHFKSEKQRRFFFAALRKGQITVPYRRTGTLGRKWTSRVTFNDADVAGFVGNNTPYGPYVQGFADQAQIHAGNWQTDQQVAQESADEVMGFFAEEISGLL
ncbi:MAG: hypothetical protein JXA21_05570 [Anaerolineae bacterium]|nr:hypothetical protein [Anaerolineae bacterium]